MKNRMGFVAIIGILGVAVTGIVGVEIREMRVPAVIESGSLDHVILDCNYDIIPSEKGQLDVKWFFRDDEQPFFQWVPGHRPQTIGSRFHNRIDLSYEIPNVSEDKKHRALKILRPTTELSGTYKCKVSSFLDEDFMKKKMTVYSPPRDVSLIYTKPDSRTINLTCSAFGVFPKPEVKISWGPSLHDHGETTTLTIERDGLYDVSVHKALSEQELKPETVFACDLTIPGTSYSVKEETMFFPGKVLYQRNISSSPPALTPINALALTLFSFMLAATRIV